MFILIGRNISATMPYRKLRTQDYLEVELKEIQLLEHTISTSTAMKASCVTDIWT